ncbi:MAG: hypothetical protein K2L41_00875 [Muribaculaceae bacterium]|nr:hypothetical protein [Muribaculaceae bacterium]
MREKKVYQYDKDWKLNHIYNLKERRWGDRGSDHMDAVCLYDGVQYVSDTDTIYRFDTEKHVMLPVIAMDMGKYELTRIYDTDVVNPVFMKIRIKN